MIFSQKGAEQNKEIKKREEQNERKKEERKKEERQNRRQNNKIIKQQINSARHVAKTHFISPETCLLGVFFLSLWAIFKFILAFNKSIGNALTLFGL